jgi:hypothetical protein
MRAIASLGCEGAARAIASNISPHACLRQDRRKPTPRFCAAGANGANIRQWWSARRKAELSEGTSPREFICHCTDKAGYISFALLHSALCTETKAQEVGVVKLLNFPAWDTRARTTCISCFPCQTATRSFLHFSAPPRSFSPACSLPPGYFFVRDCTRAGEPVRLLDGQQVLEGAVRRARHWRRLRVLRRQRRATRPHQCVYHAALGGKCVPRAVFFDVEPGVIDAVYASPLG